MGFSYESQEYSDCRFRLEEMRQSRTAESRRAGDAMMMQGLGMLYDSSRLQGYPVRTYTYPSGRVVTCTETPYTTNCI